MNNPDINPRDDDPIEAHGQRSPVSTPRMSPTSASASAREIRTVTECARCLGCGYDLRGITVVKEPHYDWFIARCSECGKANPMHGFGRDRKAVKVASVNAATTWVVAVLFFGIGWSVGNFLVGNFTMSWLAYSRPRAIVGDFYTLAIVEMAWGLPHSVILAIVLAALLPRPGRGRLVTVGLLLLLPSAFLWLIMWANATSSDSRRWRSDLDEFMMDHGLWFVPMTMTIQVVISLILAEVARPVLRVTLASLAPRSIILGLGELWTGVGLDLPKRVIDTGD